MRKEALIYFKLSFNKQIRARMKFPLGVGMLPMGSKFILPSRAFPLLEDFACLCNLKICHPFLLFAYMFFIAMN